MKFTSRADVCTVLEKGWLLDRLVVFFTSIHFLLRQLLAGSPSLEPDLSCSALLADEHTCTVQGTRSGNLWGWNSYTNDVGQIDSTYTEFRYHADRSEWNLQHLRPGQTFRGQVVLYVQPGRPTTCSPQGTASGTFDATASAHVDGTWAIGGRLLGQSTQVVLKFMQNDRSGITVLTEENPSGWDFGGEPAPGGATRLVIPPQHAHDFVIGWRKQLSSGRGLLNYIDEYNKGNKLQCGGNTRTSMSFSAVAPSCQPGFYQVGSSCYSCATNYYNPYRYQLQPVDALQGDNNHPCQVCSSIAEEDGALKEGFHCRYCQKGLDDQENQYVRSGFCFADGTCQDRFSQQYDSLKDRPNPCMQCLPSVNQWGYSPANGVNCNDDDKCTNNDRCSNGLCRGVDSGCLTLARTGRAHRACEVCSDRSASGCAIKPGFRGCVVDENLSTGEARSCGCLIGTQCFPHGASNPSNQCQVCDVTQNAADWSNNDGGQCSVGDPCTHSSSCTAGICQGTSYTCPDGPCIANSQCDGMGGCAVTFLGNDTVCRAGVDACKPEVRCTGYSGSCPRSIDIAPIIKTGRLLPAGAPLSGGAAVSSQGALSPLLTSDGRLQLPLPVFYGFPMTQNYTGVSTPPLDQRLDVVNRKLSIGAYAFQVTCGTLSYEWGLFRDPKGTRSCSAAHANSDSDALLLGGFDNVSNDILGADARDFSVPWMLNRGRNATGDESLADGDQVRAVVRVTTIRGNSRTVCSLPLRLDSSPPVLGVAIDAPAALTGQQMNPRVATFAASTASQTSAAVDLFDADTTSAHVLTISWKGFSDPHSAFDGNRLRYRYCIEVLKGPLCGEQGWTSAGIGTGSAVTSLLFLRLRQDTIYQARIRAFNRAGMYAEAVTDGVLVDFSPPSISSSYFARVSVRSESSTAATSISDPIATSPGLPRAVRLPIEYLGDASDFSESRDANRLKAAIATAATSGTEAEHRFVRHASLAGAVLVSPASDVSGIVRYEVAWGSTPGTADLDDWVVLWEAETVGRVSPDGPLLPGRVPSTADLPTATDLSTNAPATVVSSMVPGAAVFASYRIWNGAGLHTVVSTGSIGLDSTPPRACSLVVDGAAVPSGQSFQLLLQCTEPESALASAILRVASGVGQQVPSQQNVLSDTPVHVTDAQRPGGAFGSTVRAGTLLTPNLRNGVNVERFLQHGETLHLCALARNAAGLQAVEWACATAIIDETSPGDNILSAAAPANNDSVAASCMGSGLFQFQPAGPTPSATPSSSPMPSASASVDPCDSIAAAVGNCTRASPSPTPSSSASPSVSASPSPGVGWLLGPEAGLPGASVGSIGPSFFLRWSAASEDIGSLLRYDIRMLGLLDADRQQRTYGVVPGQSDAARLTSTWSNGYGGISESVHAKILALIEQQASNRTGGVSNAGLLGSSILSRSSALASASVEVVLPALEVTQETSEFGARTRSMDVLADRLIFGTNAGSNLGLGSISPVIPSELGVVVDWVSVGLNLYADLDGPEWASSDASASTTCAAEGFGGEANAPDPSRVIKTLLPPSAIQDGRAFYAQLRSVSRSGRARVKTLGPIYVDRTPPVGGLVAPGDDLCEEGDNSMLRQALQPSQITPYSIESSLGAHPCPFPTMLAGIEQSSIPSRSGLTRRLSWRHSDRLTVRFGGFGDSQSGLSDIEIAVGQCGSNPESALAFTSISSMQGWQNGAQVAGIDVTRVRRQLQSTATSSSDWEVTTVSVAGLQLQHMQSYCVSARAKNRAGLAGSMVQSLPILVDLEPPTLSEHHGASAVQDVSIGLDSDEWDTVTQRQLDLLLAGLRGNSSGGSVSNSTLQTAEAFLVPPPALRPQVSIEQPIGSSGMSLTPSFRQHRDWTSRSSGSEKWATVDADYTANSAALAVNWTGFSDAFDILNGRQLRTAIAVGSTPGKDDILQWNVVSAGTGSGVAALSIADISPVLTGGRRMFVCIMVIDAAGWTTTACSDGIIADASPPELSVPMDDSIVRATFPQAPTAFGESSRMPAFMLSEDTVVFSVVGIVDDESPVAALRWQLGTSPGLGDVVAPTDEGPSLAVGGAAGSGVLKFELDRGLVRMQTGQLYYLTVVVFNGAGLPRVIIDSRGAAVDVTPPDCGDLVVQASSMPVRPPAWAGVAVSSLRGSHNGEDERFLSSETDPAVVQSPSADGWTRTDGVEAQLRGLHEPESGIVAIFWSLGTVDRSQLPFLSELQLAASIQLAASSGLPAGSGELAALLQRTHPSIGLSHLREESALRFASGKRQAGSGWLQGVAETLYRPSVVNASDPQVARHPITFSIDAPMLSRQLQHGLTYQLSVLAVSGTGRTCASASPPFTVEDPTRPMGELIVWVGPMGGFGDFNNSVAPEVLSAMRSVDSSAHSSAIAIRGDHVDDVVDLSFRLPTEWFHHGAVTENATFALDVWSLLQLSGASLEWAVGSIAGLDDEYGWSSLRRSELLPLGNLQPDTAEALLRNNSAAQIWWYEHGQRLAGSIRPHHQPPTSQWVPLTWRDLGAGSHFISLRVISRGGRTMVGSASGVIIDTSTPYAGNNDLDWRVWPRLVPGGEASAVDYTEMSGVHYASVLGGSSDPLLLDLSWAPSTDDEQPIIAYEVCLGSQVSFAPRCGALEWRVETRASGVDAAQNQIDMPQATIDLRTANSTFLCIASPTCLAQARQESSDEWQLQYDAALAAAQANRSRFDNSSINLSGFDESQRFGLLPEEPTGLIARVRARTASGYTSMVSSKPIVVLLDEDRVAAMEHQRNAHKGPRVGNQPNGPLVLSFAVESSSIDEIVNMVNVSQNASALPASQLVRQLRSSARGLVLPTAFAWTESARPLTLVEIWDASTALAEGRTIPARSQGADSAAGLAAPTSEVDRVWNDGFAIAVGFWGVAAHTGSLEQTSALLFASHAARQALLSAGLLDQFSINSSEARDALANGAGFDIPGPEQPPLVRYEVAIGTRVGASDVRAFTSADTLLEFRTLVGAPGVNPRELTQHDVDSQQASWQVNQVRLARLDSQQLYRIRLTKPLSAQHGQKLHFSVRFIDLMGNSATLHAPFVFVSTRLPNDLRVFGGPFKKQSQLNAPITAQPFIDRVEAHWLPSQAASTPAGNEAEWIQYDADRVDYLTISIGRAPGLRDLFGPVRIAMMAEQRHVNGTTVNLTPGQPGESGEGTTVIVGPFQWSSGAGSVTLLGGSTHYVSITTVALSGLSRQFVSQGVLVDSADCTAGEVSAPRYVAAANASDPFARSVHISWSGFADVPQQSSSDAPEAASGVVGFMVGLGSSNDPTSTNAVSQVPGGTPLEVGLDTSTVFSEIHLQPSTSYYAHVWARDAAGRTCVATSHAIQVDSTPPTAGSVFELAEAAPLVSAASGGTYVDSSMDAAWISNTSWIFVAWDDGFADRESGGVNGTSELVFEVSAGLSSGTTDIIGWTPVIPNHRSAIEAQVGQSSSGNAPGSRRLLPARRLAENGAGGQEHFAMRGFIIAGAELLHGDCVHPRVRAINAAGIRGPHSAGNGACVDLKPPSRPTGLLFEAILASPEDLSQASVNVRLTWTDAVDEDGASTSASGLESIKVAFGRAPGDDSALSWTTLAPTARSRETGATQALSLGEYYATIVLRDVAGNEATFHERSFLDVTAPLANNAIVLDGIHVGEDTSVCRSPGLLTATFDGFEEIDSTLVQYLGCVGEWDAVTGGLLAPEIGRNCNFTNGFSLSSPSSSRTIELDLEGAGLSLTREHGYYFGVKAININGAASSVVWSDGCVWSVHAPELISAQLSSMLLAIEEQEELSGLGRAPYRYDGDIAVLLIAWNNATRHGDGSPEGEQRRLSPQFRDSSFPLQAANQNRRLSFSSQPDEMDAQLIHDDRITDPSGLGDVLRVQVRPPLATIGRPLRGGVATEDETQCVCAAPGMVSVPVYDGIQALEQSDVSLIQEADAFGAIESACVCGEGFEPSQLFEGLCTPCLPGYFKHQAGMHRCNACPLSSINSPMSEDYQRQQRLDAIEKDIRRVVDGHLPSRGPTADADAGASRCRCPDPVLQIFLLPEAGSLTSDASCACVAGYEPATSERLEELAFESAGTVAFADSQDGLSTQCVPCPAGSFRSNLRSNTCKLCPDGVPSLPDGTGCDCQYSSSAPRGSKFDDKAELCSCPMWSQLSPSGASCEPCPLGTFAARAGPGSNPADTFASPRVCSQCPAEALPLLDLFTGEPTCDCGATILGAVFEPSVGECGCPAGTMLSGGACVSCLAGVLPPDWQNWQRTESSGVDWTHRRAALAQTEEAVRNGTASTLMNSIEAEGGDLRSSINRARQSATLADVAVAGPIGDLFQPRWRPLSEASAPCQGICAWDAQATGNGSILVAGGAVASLVSPAVSSRPYLYLDWHSILEHKPTAPGISMIRVAVGTTQGGAQLMPFTDMPPEATRLEVRLPDGAPQSVPIFSTLVFVDDAGSQLVIEEPRPVMWETLSPSGGDAVDAWAYDWDQTWLLQRKVAQARRVVAQEDLEAANSTSAAKNQTQLLTPIDAEEDAALELARLQIAIDALNASALALSGETVLDPNYWQLDPTFTSVGRLSDADVTTSPEILPIAFEPFSGICGDACVHSVAVCLGTREYECDVVPARRLDGTISTIVAQVSFGGAALRSGVEYFATVAARSHGGLVSMSSSDGVLVDLEAPAAGFVVDVFPTGVSTPVGSADLSEDIDCIGVSAAANGSGIAGAWNGFTDTASPLFVGSLLGPNLQASSAYPAVKASGLREFKWCIGTSGFFDDVLPWAPVGLQTRVSDSEAISRSLAAGVLNVGDMVFVSVRAYDRAGHFVEASSDGVRLVCDPEARKASSWGCGTAEAAGEDNDQAATDEGDFLCFNSFEPASQSHLAANSSSVAVQLATGALVRTALNTAASVPALEDVVGQALTF